MRHPNETDLALYAGGELGWFERRRVARHLSECVLCRREAEAFGAARSELAASAAEIPAEVNWGRLAAEMRANIHVGLAAGECVGSAEVETWPFFRRAAATVVPVALLLLAGWWLQSDRPHPAEMAAEEGVVLRATSEGIELREGGRLLSLQNHDSQDVTYTVSMQGAIRARYVDSETGQVTINHVYAQ